MTIRPRARAAALAVLAAAAILSFIPVKEGKAMNRPADRPAAMAAVPPIDAAAPRKTATAVFALG